MSAALWSLQRTQQPVETIEVGIRIPFIAVWKGKIKAGSSTGYPAAFWDLFPTFEERLAAEAQRLNERLVHRALSLDGTCTGEHGIGCGKIDFLLAEHGEAVSVMRAIKKAIDSDNIMNPGKILRI